jgi:glycosyltransferase involved in cell wall biosynthesis
VGGGTLEKKLHHLAVSLGIDDHVQFVGKIADDELRDWYRAADLFVLPTLAEEGFGMVTAEALSAGTAVVGTAIGATPELLAPLDPRLIADGTDPAALAAAIRRGLALATDEFRRRCREYACSQLSWEKTLPGWEQALLEAAGAAPA